MANRRQPLIPIWWWPGLLAAGLILTIATLALGSLWHYAPESDWRNLWQDSYLCFTFWQALLSALLSVLPAILLARALYRRRFPGRQWLLRLCAMTLVLPVLVAVFGLLSVYGLQGWLATLCGWLGVNYSFSPYGLRGILLAHLFFNLPLASRLLLHALENIPVEQRQLAVQLGMNNWQQWRIVEWPALRRALPVGNTHAHHWRNPADSQWCRIVDGLLIAAALLLLLPPLLAVMTNGINQALASVLQQPQLWQALMTSLRIALGAGLLCVALTLMLLWSSRELKLRQRLRWSQTLELSGMVILAMPGIVLATGFFLLLSHTLGVPQSPYALVILSNALM
ncbi:MAG: ABC transporter permease subunit, partial [Serratia symbiotica]|nr:ABC transporter permease subunit [Serratia symbiotica]